MAYPPGLRIVRRAGTAPEGPVVVLVHDSLDRAGSFRRVGRRLPEFTVVAYDRRGYQDSRAAGVVDLAGHIVDLVEVLRQLRALGAARLAAVGHSMGGLVVLGAALADPEACDSVGAFEPPLPWLGFGRPSPDHDPGGGSTLSGHPADEAEMFFHRVVGGSAWQRLPVQVRAGLCADGPALVADLSSLRGDPPFTVTDLAVPALFGAGGTGTAPQRREGVAWLGAHVPGAATYAIPAAPHGAHLSHPDHFAAFVRAVVERIPLPPDAVA